MLLRYLRAYFYFKSKLININLILNSCMKDSVKHEIAKEMYANGKAFLWGCLASLLILVLALVVDWEDDIVGVLFYGSPFLAIVIRYMILAYKWVIKWK